MPPAMYDSRFESCPILLPNHFGAAVMEVDDGGCSVDHRVRFLLLCCCFCVCSVATSHSCQIILPNRFGEAVKEAL